MSEETSLRLIAFSSAAKADLVYKGSGVAPPWQSQEWIFGLLSLRGEPAPASYAPRILLVTQAAYAADRAGVDALVEAGACVLVAAADGSVTALGVAPDRGGEAGEARTPLAGLRAPGTTLANIVNRALAPKRPGPAAAVRKAPDDEVPPNTVAAAIRVLEGAGKPMSASDIRRVVTRRWGIAFNSPTPGPRLCTLDRGLWGLADRDIQVDADLRRSIVDYARAAIRRNPVDAGVLYARIVKRTRGAWTGSPTLLATILRLDAGIAADRNGTFRLA